MSYATKIGDEFYEMNPTDAREGDEIYIGDDWRDWKKHCGEQNCQTHEHRQRRRLIAPGEGWRILGMEEAIGDGAEFTSDGVTWKTMWDEKLRTPRKLEAKHDNIIAIRQRIPVEAEKENEFAQVLASVPVESNTGRMICSFCQWSNVGLLNIADTGDVPKYICHGCVKRELDNRSSSRIQAVIDAARVYVNFVGASSKHHISEYRCLESALAALGEDVCASCGHTKLDHQYITCPQFKPKEPTKDDEYPHYWLSALSLYRVDYKQHCGCFWLPDSKRWETSADAVQFEEYAKANAHNCKRLTPAEAQARMGGKAREPLVDKLEVLITTISDDVLSQDWEYNSNHRQLITDILRRHLKAVPPPAEDELKVLLERVKNWQIDVSYRIECDIIKHWIEDAMKGRKRNEP